VADLDQEVQPFGSLPFYLSRLAIAGFEGGVSRVKVPFSYFFPWIQFFRHSPRADKFR